MKSCNTCVHRGQSEAFGNSLVILTDCRHPKVSGLMGCLHCNTFHLLETFQLVTAPGKPPRLRCPADGCRHLQSLPDETDWRVGYVGARKREQDQPAPDWCPGYEQGEPDQQQQPAKKPEKKLSRKARRQLMPSLFD